MTTAKTSTYDHADLRPAIGTKGLDTFHLELAGDEPLEAACGTELDALAYSTTKRLALRRGLELCSKCAAIEAEEPEPELPEPLEYDPNPGSEYDPIPVDADAS